MNGSRALLRPIGTSIGRLLVLVAALAGLFAMHGLSDHGWGGPAVVAGDAQLSAQTSAQLSARTSAHMSMVHADEAVTTPVPAATTTAPPTQEPTHHGHDVGTAGLCLAVLVAALLIGWSLWLTRRRPLPSWRPVSPRLRPILAWVAPARSPDLLALSIQRC